MALREFGILDTTGKDGRWQDATMIIRAPGVPANQPLDADDELVVIAKHWYPQGIYRFPSGGVRPGESILDTATREAREETGLEVRLFRYVLATDGIFYLGDRAQPERTQRWRSHVFYAEAHGEIEPQDVREIKEARLVPARDLQERFHPLLLQTQIGGFRYRVGLEERALAALGAATVIRVTDDGDTEGALQGYRL
jgi:8-oxo-dGTP pyrophosphatase MutT (NUDIX family)